MANRTDPLISSVSGSDPQNLMEYLTRQRIYDCRYWKETCFGLTVADVLQESTKVAKKASDGGCIAIGHLQFLALTLKLLQLHPDGESITTTFVQQDAFHYTRALGALYLRLTGRPAEIYHALEPLYQDGRPLRHYNAHATGPEAWTTLHMDEWIHLLLTEPHVAGITLPRLPQRHVLQEAGYLEEGPRETALNKVLEDYGNQNNLNDNNDDDNMPVALHYLRHKALTEKNPAALDVWNEKYAKYYKEQKTTAESSRPKKKAKGSSFALFQDDDKTKKKKKKKKKSQPETTDSSKPEEGSEEYWNEQRAKLGLAPLRK